MKAYLKKRIISKIARPISNLGIHHLAGMFYGGIGHILMFHRIVPESQKTRIHNHLSLEITPEHLKIIIEYFLKRDYKFLSMDELYDGFIKGTLGNQKFVVLTFDDGYIDNLEIAYPILKKYNIPFTIYIATGIPNNTAILWWYLLEEMVLEMDVIEFRWKEKEYFLSSGSVDEKEKVFEFIQNFYHQNFTSDDQLELLQAIFKDFRTDLTRYSEKYGMSWEQIRELNSDPLVSIGAHTVNHFNLAKLGDEALRSEILDSKLELEKQLKHSVRHFAYPYGKESHASGREFECVEQFGFHTATTTKIGNLYEAHSKHLCCLPRINMNRVTNDHVLKLQTSGFIPMIVNKGRRIIL